MITKRELIGGFIGWLVGLAFAELITVLTVGWDATDSTSVVLAFILGALLGNGGFLVGRAVAGRE